jgi:asparagine synthase (glutamine-hydrolysing)
MCGIIGAYKPQGSGLTPSDLLARMRDRMTHRGPDGAGLWREREERCVLGHRRLSIIDLSDAAAQPMLNDDGRVVITFNGEIYNHAELRKELEATGKFRWKTDHSDTEMMLRAYEHWGIDCVKRFIGMFAFVIYDARVPDRPVMHLVRDRIGKKPIYFHKSARGEWLFASEIRALLAHPDITPDMEPVAFWHYLTFIVTPAPLTLFRGVFKVPPATVVSIDHTGAARSHVYWECRPSAEATLKEKDLSFDDAVKEFTSIFRTAIKRRMVSDVPFGVLLSGGVDSSLNVALMAEQMDRPVTTFTVGYSEYEDFNEFHHARRHAERYVTDHHEVRITSDEAMQFFPLLVELQDEPIADNVCIPLYFLAKLVKDRRTTVVQVGEGADENFLGYWWCEHYRNKHESVYRPAREAGRLTPWQRIKGSLPDIGPLGDGEDREIRLRALKGEQLFWGGATCWWGSLRDQLTPDPGPYRGRVDCPVPGLLPEGFLAQNSHNVIDHHLGRYDGRLAEPEVLQKITAMELSLRLPEHLLMRVDKMTMASSIEARVPFLDPDLVEFAMRLPLAYKLSNGVGKRLVKKAAEPYVDHELLYRRKQGFGAPMDKWFTEDRFGRKCLAAYERSALRKRGFFNDDYLHGLLKGQVAGTINYGFHLWTVMNAVLWYERWMDGGLKDF